MMEPRSALCHALIIEDECLIAMDLAGLVEMAGATSVAFASTEGEAIESARTHPPDVILSDVKLFEGSGPRAVRAIVIAHGEIPVMFITASPDACGPVGQLGVVLLKPVIPAQVVATFSQLAADRLGTRQHEPHTRL